MKSVAKQVEKPARVAKPVRSVERRPRVPARPPLQHARLGANASLRTNAEPATDPAEREAERIASEVGVATGTRCACGGVAGPRGECAACHARRMAQLERAAAPSNLVPSGGRALEPRVRAPLEQHLGKDLSAVRVHDGDRAAELAEGLGARAYAAGANVVLGRRAARTRGFDSVALMAHEVAHAIQQASGRAAAPQLMPDAITAIMIDLASNTVTVTIDEGETITGVLGDSTLEAGNYTARWEGDRLVIEPAPADRDINFVVQGDPAFLRRFDALRRRLRKPIPFVVLPAPREPGPQEGGGETVEGETGESAPAEPLDPNAVYMTPEEIKTRCETGDLPDIKTFPLRLPKGLTRWSSAPIHAEREGDRIRVWQPMSGVFADPMFRRETRTLPLETFTKGVLLEPNEVVRVRLYDLEEGDTPKYVCATGEGMMRLSDLTDRAIFISILMTAIDALLILIPGGMLAKPLVAGGRILRIGTASAMLGLAEVPALAGRAGTTLTISAVEREAVVAVAQATTTRAVTTTVTETAVQAAEHIGVTQATGAATKAAVSGVTAATLTQAALQTGAVAATDIAAGAVEKSATETAAQTVAQEGLKPVAGATEQVVSQADYGARLGAVFPGQAANAGFQMVEEIGQQAAAQVVQNPAFVQAVQNGNWALAGTLFHAAACAVGRNMILPAGWVAAFELTVQGGLGGSRLDILLRDPTGLLIEIDWKTTGRSALTVGARSEMARHATQTAAAVGQPVSLQLSKSWIDFVRPFLPNIPWPR